MCVETLTVRTAHALSDRCSSGTRAGNACFCWWCCSRTTWPCETLRLNEVWRRVPACYSNVRRGGGGCLRRSGKTTTKSGWDSGLGGQHLHQSDLRDFTFLWSSEGGRAAFWSFGTKKPFKPQKTAQIFYKNLLFVTVTKQNSTLTVFLSTQDVITCTT